MQLFIYQLAWLQNVFYSKVSGLNANQGLPMTSAWVCLGMACYSRFCGLLLRWRTSWTGWHIKSLNHFSCRWRFFTKLKKINKTFSAEAHVKERQTERERARHIWGLSCSPKALALVTRTWGKGQNIFSPHTQSPRESRGVNPVSGKPGLTLVNPAAAAEAATQNEMPRTSLAHVHVHNYFDSYTEQNTRRQTYIVWPQSGGFRCVICSPFPTLAQLCLWSGSNVDSCRPVT